MKKKLQKRRMMSYFIDAADYIITNEGIDQITLRKVADRAGYNSATLYNYFENLDHLIFFASMRQIKDYSEALPKSLESARDAMDKFFVVWDCFCKYAYKSPEIYNILFFPNLNKHFEDYVADYYKFYPDELIQGDSSISTMLLKTDINERGQAIVNVCAEEGFILEDDIGRLNDLSLLIFEGMLKRILREKISYDDARKTTMAYIEFVVKGLLQKDYDFEYQKVK